MMDFLRHLAPDRATDTARALAVLPSRFSGWLPLQGNLDAAHQALHPDDGFTRWSPTNLPPVESPTAAAQRRAGTRIQPVQASPARLFSEKGKHENEPVLSPPQAAAQAPSTPETHFSRSNHHQVGGNAERSADHRPQATHRKAVMPTAMATVQHASVLVAQAQGARPLSDASLAQRASPSQDDGPVVHVTIGRIEVVAQTAPVQAPARRPAPRQPAVTLADYLRGSSHGGRS